MNVHVTKIAVAATAMFLSASTWAATDTANLAVSATVVNVCAIGPGTLAFGSIGLGVNSGAGTLNPVNHDADSGSTISVVCTNGTTAAITAGFGANALLTVRRMISGGADFLTYELYTDAGRLTTLNAINAVSYTGTGLVTSQTVYGRITGAQLAAAKKGSYTDTVAMTITYTP